MTCLVSLSLPEWVPLAISVVFAFIIFICVLICYIMREVDRYKNFYGKEDFMNSKYEKELKEELEETEEMMYKGYKNEVLVIASPITQHSPGFGLKVLMTKRTSKGKTPKKLIEPYSSSKTVAPHVISILKDKLARGTELLELLAMNPPIGDRLTKAQDYLEMVRVLLEKMTLNYFVVYGRFLNGGECFAKGEERLQADVDELSLEIRIKIHLPEPFVVSAFQIHTEFPSQTTTTCSQTIGTGSFPENLISKRTQTNTITISRTMRDITVEDSSNADIKKKSTDLKKGKVV